MNQAAPDVILEQAEVEHLAGGYKRASDQLRRLKERGYYRAWRSPVTGLVIVERAHYEAVAAGQAQPKPEKQVRLLVKPR